ncbi:MAG: (deoxy)nucleoside triphosphate pyrophosphohydrolase [Gemmatimonadetes bacterium]|nr:(deoxy)nucleoside triphosphate pyrophosphohydrolase [Gemmatimonadota bacterium]
MQPSFDGSWNRLSPPPLVSPHNAMQQAPISVVAAVIQRDGRYLVGRRPPDKRHGGLWEFPGGKVDAGESMLDAIRRELIEELAVSTSHIGRTLFSSRDGDTPFVIHFVEVEIEGEPVPREHTEVAWVTPSELGALSLAPADAAFVGELDGLGG